MNVRTRVLRTVGFNLACLAVFLVPLWLSHALLAPLLIRHGVVEPAYDFYSNFPSASSAPFAR